MSASNIRRHLRHGALAALVVAAGAASSLAGCTTDERGAPTTSTQRSAVETSPSTSGEPTFQKAAKEPLDWKSVLGELSKENVFRIVYKAKTNAKSRSDDGMSALDPAEQKILAEYDADMKEVYGLYALRGDAGLDDKQRGRVATLQKKYAAARQELFKVLMARPELSGDGRAALLSAIDHVNGTRAMQLDPSNH